MSSKQPDKVCGLFILRIHYIMFEKIVLRRSELGHELSLGELAEALLFYQNVHIILDRGTLITLSKSIGFNGLISLLSRPNVSAVYIEEQLGTYTTHAAVQHHSFQSFYLSGHQDIGALKSKNERLEYSLTSVGFDKKTTHKFVDKFKQLVPFKKFSDDYYLPGGIIKAAVEDLKDEKFIHEAMRRVLSTNEGVDSVLGDFRFEVMTNESGFYIFTNIDFASINKKRKPINNQKNDLTEAHLISEILTTRADIALAAHYGGEFYTSNLSSEIIRLRYKELIKRIGIETEEIKQWQNIVISDAPQIKEVINAQERTFTEFLKLLDKSQKFRDWIQAVNQRKNCPCLLKRCHKRRLV